MEEREVSKIEVVFHWERGLLEVNSEGVTLPEALGLLHMAQNQIMNDSGADDEIELPEAVQKQMRKGKRFDA